MLCVYTHAGLTRAPRYTMAKAMIMRILAKLFACSHLHALLSLCALKLARELQEYRIFFFSISDFCLHPLLLMKSFCR